jgi:hypothetical protein
MFNSAIFCNLITAYHALSLDSSVFELLNSPVNKKKFEPMAQNANVTSSEKTADDNHDS